MESRIRRPALLATTLAVAAAAPAHVVAQSPSDVGFESCEAEVRTHPGWLADPDTTWSLSIDAAPGGVLRYLGARHSDDPADPQFEAIAAAWEDARPTRAFFEGPDRGIADTAKETIERFGESGYVRYLAARDSVPVATLEPSPFDEAAYLRERFPEEQVALFYLLREASRLRERKGMDGPAIEAAVGDLLARAREMGLLRGEVDTVEALDGAYRRYWSEPAEWWRAPVAWFDPLKSSEESGGIFTNEVNRASSRYRDLHMARLLVETVASGERVIAVVGRNHVPLQAPAIRCGLCASCPTSPFLRRHDSTFHTRIEASLADSRTLPAPRDPFDPTTDPERPPALRRPWVAPTVTALPPLRDLTLQTCTPTP